MTIIGEQGSVQLLSPPSTPTPVTALLALFNCVFWTLPLNCYSGYRYFSFVPYLNCAAQYILCFDMGQENIIDFRNGQIVIQFSLLPFLMSHQSNVKPQIKFHYMKSNEREKMSNCKRNKRKLRKNAIRQRKTNK